MSDFKVGERLRDKVSGFTGIAMSKVEYFSGCIQYLVDPEQLNKETNAKMNGVYFDLEQLEKVDDGLLEVREEKKRPGGGMHDNLPTGFNHP